MNIWILTSETLWYNAGGIARYVDNFARNLARQGHHCTIISRGSNDELRELEPGCHLLQFRTNNEKWVQEQGSLPPDQQDLFPYNTLDYWTALAYQYAEVVRERVRQVGPPDIIESQEYCAIAYYLLQRRLVEPGFLDGVPVVLNLHSPDFITREMNEESRWRLPYYWTGRMERFCMLAADACISPSRYLARQVEEIMVEHSLRVKPFPLPWTDVSKLKSEAAPAIEEGRVVYFGRLEVRKGTARLLEACERLWREGLDFRLTLIGGDTHYFPRGMSMERFLRQKYARRLESGQLEIPGAMPQEDLLRRLRSAALVTIPSLWENFPNTCMEAMSLGKVVIASRHGGQAEMVGEDSAAGLVFSWDNAGEFENCLREGLSLDLGRRAAMGQFAQERIAALCNPQIVIKHRLKHFEEVRAAFRPATQYPFNNLPQMQGLADRTVTRRPFREGLVSVVIPFYNLGSTIRDTLDSIRASDYQPLEIILINDGSNDPESLRVLAEIEAANIPGLRLHHKPNGGLAAARNSGAELAEGEFIALVDADDQLEPIFISRALHVMRRFENVHIVFSWERYFDHSHDLYPGWDFEFPYLLAHNLTCPLSVVRRDYFLSFGRNKSRMSYNFEDYESWISMTAAGCGGVCLPDPLVRYRIRPDGLWQTAGRDQHLFLFDLITKEHPQLYAQYGADLFNLQNANGPSQAWLKPAAPSPYDERLHWLEDNLHKVREHRDRLEQRLQQFERDNENRRNETEYLRKQLSQREEQIQCLDAQLRQCNEQIRLREAEVETFHRGPESSPAIVEPEARISAGQSFWQRLIGR